MGTSNKSTNGQTKARSSLPSFLQIKKSTIPNAQLGVFTSKRLPKGYRFGPYEGDVLKKTELTSDMDPTYQWEVYNKKGNYVIDGHNENTSNWMRFVNCARIQSEQNLDAVQIRGKIYYITYKRVDARKELMVWYGDHCAKTLGIDVNNHSNETVGNIADPSKLELIIIPNQPSRCTPNNHKSDVTSNSTKPPLQRTLNQNRKCEKLANSTLSKQKNAHEQNNNQKVKCTCYVCFRRFSSWKSLSRHLRVKHGKNQCSKCFRHFTTSAKLKSHTDIRHKGSKVKTKEKKQCKVCGKFVSKRSSFRRHLKTHMTIGNIISHLQVKKHLVNSSVAQKQFQCSVCTKSFFTENGFVSHLIESSHASALLKKPPKVNENPELVFACKVCGKLYSTSRGKNLHQNVVHGVRVSARQKKITTICPEKSTRLPNTSKFNLNMCKQTLPKNNVKDDMQFHFKGNGKDTDGVVKSVKQTNGLLAEQIKSRPFTPNGINSQPKKSPIKPNGTYSQPKKSYFIKCNICEGLLKSDREMRVHYKYCLSRKQTRRPWVEDQEPEQDILQCEDCGKCFGKKSNLIIHLRMHQDFSQVSSSETSEWFPHFRSLLPSSFERVIKPLIRVFNRG